MDSSALLRLRQFAARVRWARALGGWADAMALLAVAAAVGLLLGRIFGHVPRLPVLGAVLLLGPVAWALYRVAQVGVGDRARAAFLDRRFGLKGLLLAGLERPTPAWDGELRARLAASRAALPRLRVRGLARRVGLPWLLLVAVFLLPAPAPAGAVLHPHVAATLGDLDEDLDLALEQGAIDEKRGEELRTRLKKLRDDLEEAGTVSWSDVDALSDKLAHEMQLHASRAESTRQALTALAAKARAGEADAPALAREVAELLRKAAEAGHLADVPPELLEKLRAADPSGAASSDLSAEELARLAEAMADAMRNDAGANLGALADAADGAPLEDLRALMSGEFAPKHEHGPP